MLSATTNTKCKCPWIWKLESQSSVYMGVVRQSVHSFLFTIDSSVCLKNEEQCSKVCHKVILLKKTIFIRKCLTSNFCNAIKITAICSLLSNNFVEIFIWTMPSWQAYNFEWNANSCITQQFLSSFFWVFRKSLKQAAHSCI